MTPTDPMPPGRHPGRTARPLREVMSTFPLRPSDVGLLVVMLAVVVAVGVAAGEAITHSSRDSWLQRNDLRVEQWFVAHRTPTWNSLSFVGSEVADTLVKVVATAVVAVTLLLVWRRWLEPALIVIALLFEAAAFITITTIVDRPRPAVVRLDSSPVGSSFPSGHVAAATVYGAFVVVVFWHTRSRVVRAASVVVLSLVVVGVATSRMYRGMHHPSDVLGGLLLGIVSVWITWWVIRRAERVHPTRCEDGE